MITVKLVGRLANQLFEISACIAYALRHGQQYHIPRRSADNRIWPTTIHHLENSGWLNAPSIVLKEPGHDYTPLPWKDEYKGRNITLDGYFQSYKYWEDHRDEVLTALRLPYQRQEHVVGIHVRRGDYLQYPEHHPAQPYAYYRDAVQVFYEKGYRTFIVCSDDIKWCREKFAMLSRDLPGAVFNYSEGLTPFADLVLLSTCDHHIIANSSFSLYAHLACRYSDKFCIAPEQWFGSKNAHLETRDMYPENCMKL